MEEVVDAAAQFKSSLSAEDAFDLCARCARGEAMRSVTIAKDSPLRPALFQYRPMYPHPLLEAAARFENDCAMRKIQHLRAGRRAWTAVIDDRPWCLEELYLCGFPLNEPDAAGLTPLHLACHLGFFRCVEILLNTGLDPDASRTLGANITPLESALAAGHQDIVDLLRGRGFGRTLNTNNNNSRHQSEASFLTRGASEKSNNKNNKTTVVDDLARAHHRPTSLYYYVE